MNLTQNFHFGSGIIEETCCATTPTFILSFAIHGGVTDVIYRAGKIDLIKSYINAVHDLGIMAGISTHNPKILDTLRTKDWPTDFYMAAFHYLSRRPEGWRKDIGDIPVGEGFIASDPPKMCEAVR